MNARQTWRTRAGALLVGLVAAGTILSVPGTAAAQDVSVTVDAAREASADVGVQSVDVRYAVNGAAIRTNPSLRATVVGRGYRWHSAIAHCWSLGSPVNGERLWVFHTNRTTRVSGWTSTLLFDDFNDLPPCRMAASTSIDLPGVSARLEAPVG